MGVYFDFPVFVFVGAIHESPALGRKTIPRTGGRRERLMIQRKWDAIPPLAAGRRPLQTRGECGGNSCRDLRGGDGKRWVSFACSGLFVMDQLEDATFFEIGGFYNGQLDDDLRVGLLPIGSFPDLDMLGGNVRLLFLRI